MSSKKCALLRRRGKIHQRMPDECHRDAGVAIDRFLEWKNHQHEIRDLAHGLQPSAPPGPELRTDVVNDRYAEPLDPASEPEIEIREIDGHQRVRGIATGGVDETPHGPKGLRQLAD